MIGKIWFTLLLINLINIKYKNKFLRVIELAGMTLILSCNNSATDNLNIAYSFFNVTNGIHDYDITNFFSVGVIMQTLGRAGLSFNGYKFLMSFLCLLLLDKGLSRITKNTSVVYLLYNLTSILLDATLFRQFLATTIVVYSFGFIVREKADYKKYTIGILIATLFHFSMAFFLIYTIGALKIKTSNLIRLAIAISVVMFSFSFVNGMKIPFVGTLLKLIGSERASSYGASNGVRLGWLLILVLWITLFYASANMEMYSCLSELENETICSKGLYSLVGVSIFFVPLSMITLVFGRIFRTVVFIFFAMIGNSVENQRPKTTIVVPIFISCLIAILAYTYVFNNMIFDYDQTIKAVLDGSLFWVSQ